MILSKVKRVLSIITILLVLFFTVGCSSKAYTMEDVKFNKEMTIDLNSKASLFSLIHDVDGIKPKKENIKGNTFSFYNLSIEYKKFNTNKEGIYPVTFYSNDPNAKSFTKNIEVADISKPKIKLKKKKLTVYTDEIDSIDYYKYFSYTDNSNKDDLTCVIYSNKVEKKAGTYTVSIKVFDKANNSSSAHLKVVIEDCPTPIETDTEVPSSNQNSTTQNQSKTNTSTGATSNNQNSSQQSAAKPPVQNKSNPSQYNKYFSGNSIDKYNEACSYAENIYSSGKVNGYEVMPDGNGFNVTFN